MSKVVKDLCAKPAGKEEEICRAVIRLMASGANAYTMTVQQIADEAGIGKGTLYEYFSAREEIVAKAVVFRMREELEELRILCSAQAAFQDKMYSLLDFSCQGAFSRGSSFQMILSNLHTGEMHQLLCKNEMVRSSLATDLRELMHNLILQGVQEGVITMPPSERIGMLALVGMVFSYVNLAHATARQDLPELRNEAYQVFCSAFQKV